MFPYTVGELVRVTLGKRSLFQGELMSIKRCYLKVRGRRSGCCCGGGVLETQVQEPPSVVSGTQNRNRKYDQKDTKKKEKENNKTNEMYVIPPHYTI